jgi:hypothetical protein
LPEIWIFVELQFFPLARFIGEFSHFLVTRRGNDEDFLFPTQLLVGLQRALQTLLQWLAERLQEFASLWRLLHAPGIHFPVQIVQQEEQFPFGNAIGQAGRGVQPLLTRQE